MLRKDTAVVHCTVQTALKVKATTHMILTCLTVGCVCACMHMYVCVVCGCGFPTFKDLVGLSGKQLIMNAPFLSTNNIDNDR